MQKWLDQATYDLDTARAMLESGRYVYVLFCCQQAVEKALKALIVHRTGAFPPRIHNLPRLAETAGIALEQGRLDFIGELSVYYIQTRYPEESATLASAATQDKTTEALRAADELITWLLSTIK